MKKEVRQFGLWQSPISPQMLAGETRLMDVQWAGDAETLVWVEGRDGRGVLMVRRPGQAARVVNDGLSVRGGCGYGGGEFTVHGEYIYFATTKGQIYKAHLDKGAPRPITPELGGVASPVVSPDGQWVVFVQSKGEVDRLILVDSDGKRWPQIAVEGGDFYMQPAWHPTGDRLSWVRWDHPNMPWTEARIESAMVAPGAGDFLAGPVEVVAAKENVAFQQPQYSPDGQKLAFLSDESGWWQLVVRDLATGQEQTVSAAGREYGGPGWVQGLRFYGWAADSQSLFALSASQGMSRLERCGLDGKSEVLEEFSEYTTMAQIAVAPGPKVACIAQSSTIPPRIISAVVGEAPKVEQFSGSERLSGDNLASAAPVSWPAPDGSGEVHGLYYEPTNARFEGVGKPPALIMIHGGPTAQRAAEWVARNQFFASRGFAVLDVNYRGSTGYGREYMEALFGKWGLVDVEDAVGGARFLVDEGLADAEKLVIMGGSAGGYTVLKALVDHPGFFKAGVCLYGISDLFALQAGTHKFESHYNDTLIGPLPEAADLYRERSPLFVAEKIEDAVAIYHGAKDQVVPIDQAEAIVGSLRRRGVPHLYHIYEDEGHGWRKGETIVHFHESLLKFLEKQVVYG